MNKKKIEDKDAKAFHLRMPKETWLYIKRTAMNTECTMTDVVINCLDKQRRKAEKRLTEDDTDV